MRSAMVLAALLVALVTPDCVRPGVHSEVPEGGQIAAEKVTGGRSSAATRGSRIEEDDPLESGRARKRTAEKPGGERRDCLEVAERIRALAGEDWAYEVGRSDVRGTLSGPRAWKITYETGAGEAFSLFFQRTRSRYVWSPSVPARAVDVLGFGEERRWFYLKGSYGEAHPAEWAELLRKIRGEFGIPEPERGVQCYAHTRKEVYTVGEPIRIQVLIRGKVPKATEWIQFRRQLRRYMKIKGPDGRVLGFGSAGGGEETIAPKHLVSGGFGGYGGSMVSFRLDDAYDFSEPGFYAIKARCKVGDDPARYAVSAAERIRLIPPDLLDVQLERLNSDGPIEVGDRVPVRVRLVTGWRRGEELSELRFHFLNSVPPETYKQYLGVPRPPEDFEKPSYGWRAPWSPERRAYRADLGSDVFWGYSGAFGPHGYLWDAAEPGTRWRVYAVMDGELSGLRFHIVSDPIELEFAEWGEGEQGGEAD